MWRGVQALAAVLLAAMTVLGLVGLLAYDGRAGVNCPGCVKFSCIAHAPEWTCEMSDSFVEVHCSFRTAPNNATTITCLEVRLNPKPLGAQTAPNTTTTTIACLAVRLNPKALGIQTAPNATTTITCLAMRLNPKAQGVQTAPNTTTSGAFLAVRSGARGMRNI